MQTDQTPETTRYPNGDKRGEALGTTDQHYQRRGARGEGSCKRAPNKPSKNNTEAKQPTKKGVGKGKAARPPGDRKHKRRNTTNKTKTTETNHRSNRESKTPRDQTKGEPPRESVSRYKREFNQHVRGASREARSSENTRRDREIIAAQE